MINDDKEAKSLILFPVSRKDFIVLHIIANVTIPEQGKNIFLPDNFVWTFRM